MELIFLLTGAMYILGWIGLVTCLAGLAAWVFFTYFGLILKLFLIGALVIAGFTAVLVGALMIC